MALVRDIIYKARPKLSQLIAKEVQTINLKGVNRVTIKFDPFRNDVKFIRDFAHVFYTKPLTTNPKCLVKTEILTDRSEQSITFELQDGKQFIFKCANLKTLEIFELINKHITPLAPAEEIYKKVHTKSQKKK